MKRIAVILILFLTIASLGTNATVNQDQATLAITHINVIDATGSPVQTDMTVLVQGNHILDIGRTGRVKIPKNAKVIDSTGKFMIPGLWDMHVHLVFGRRLPGGKEAGLPLFVANGVTGVRDMGGDLTVQQGWRSEINAGTLIGPRLVLAGPMLVGPKSGYASSLAVANAAEGAKAVDDLKAKGADFIKVQSNIPRDAYFAVAEEAKKQGITFVGHVPDAVRASEAAEAGQKSIEHLTGIFEGSSTKEDEFLKGKKTPKTLLDTYSEANKTKLIELLAQHHTWQVPTLVWERGQWLVDDIDYSNDPYLKYAPLSWREKTWPSFKQGIMRQLDTDDVTVRRRFVEKEFEIVGAMHKAGIPFLAGTDTIANIDVLPGFSLHTEMEYFVKAGFTPMEALQTATRNPAEFLGRQNEMGTIEKGKLADLVILDQNPLVDIRNTRKISAVILNGRLLNRTELDRLLEEVAAFSAKN